MTRQTVATGLAVVTLGLGAVAAVLVLATLSVEVPDSWAFRGAPIPFAVTCGAVGAVVTQRRPEHTIGWLFLVIGFLFAIESLIDAYTVISVLVAPADLPGQPWLGWTLTWLWVPPIGLAFIFLPLLFPTGHLPSERWRPVAWLGVVGTTAFAIAIAFAPGPIQQATYLDNPIHPFGDDVAAYGVIEGIGVLPFGIAVILAVASLVRRFGAGDDVARRQIKWFALAATVAATAYACYVVSYLLAHGTPLAKAFEVTQVAAVIGMPVAAGLAILRYRLFEIDRIISRTISYGLVTGSLVTAYALAILVLQGPLESVTGGETIAVALSTLVAAALFQPLRTRVKASVDRRFDRARFDADRTTAAFAERMRDEVDIDAVAADLHTTVQVSIQPAGLGLWLRGTGR